MASLLNKLTSRWVPTPISSTLLSEAFADARNEITCAYAELLSDMQAPVYICPHETVVYEAGELLVWLSVHQIGRVVGKRGSRFGFGGGKRPVGDGFFGLKDIVPVSFAGQRREQFERARDMLALCDFNNYENLLSAPRELAPSSDVSDEVSVQYCTFSKRYIVSIALTGTAYHNSSSTDVPILAPMQPGGGSAMVLDLSSCTSFS